MDYDNYEAPGEKYDERAILASKINVISITWPILQFNLNFSAALFRGTHNLYLKWSFLPNRVIAGHHYRPLERIRRRPIINDVVDPDDIKAENVGRSESQAIPPLMFLAPFLGATWAAVPVLHPHLYITSL